MNKIANCVINKKVYSRFQKKGKTESVDWWWFEKSSNLSLATKWKLLDLLCVLRKVNQKKNKKV